MQERFVVYMLAGALAAVLLWRAMPRPAAAAVKAGADTLGQAVIVPTIPAELIVGQSLTPDDGAPGPTWYCVNYPGARPGMPAIPSAIAL